MLMLFKNSDKYKLIQLYINWFMLCVTMVYMGSVFFMTFPTLHSYIVTPKSENCSQPGLGGSETEFSIAAGIYSGGAVFWGFASIVLHSLSLMPIKLLMSITAVVPGIGMLIYGLATEAWMVIIARFFQGSVGSLALLVMIWYCVSSVDDYEQLCIRMNKPTNKRLKRQLTIVFSLLATGAYVGALGIVSIVSQFDSVDQFRFPAWFNLSFSILLVIMTLVLFKDIGKETKPNLSLKNINWREKLKPPKIGFTSFMIVVLLLYNAAIIDGTLTMIESINAPLLSRYFGFRISEIAYFTTGVAAIFPLSCILLFVLEKFRVSSRYVLLVALLINIIGLIILSDWQYISNDSVSQCARYSLSEASNTTDSAVECQEDRNQSRTTHSEEKSSCMSNRSCYWNQKSIITGSYCEECPAVCLSETGSLDFYQFSVAVFLIGLSIDMVRYNTLPLICKVVPIEYEFTATGLQIFIQSITRMVFPMWYVPYLVYADWHTTIPTGVILALHGPSLIGYFLLCSKISSKYGTNTSNDDDDNADHNTEHSERRPSTVALINVHELKETEV